MDIDNEFKNLMQKMKESEIRDLLIQNLHILNPNYKFLSKEAYLPSEIGTRSFIDILACDEKGKYVVIELKKSNTTARQAIHELFKYLEAVKENLAIKTDEIELVVVSTEWDELLVPFSSFVSNVNLKTFGFQLFIENDKIFAKEINVFLPNVDRILSSVQMASYYYTLESLEVGIEEHINFFTKRDIESFVLIVLKAPENYKQMVLDSIRSFETEAYGNFKTINIDSIPNYEYMIYSANQLLSLEKYTEICSKYYSDFEIDENIDEILNNEEASLYDKMEQFNDFILEQEPFPKSDYFEIGTPAKYNKFKEFEGWKLLEIKRYGALSENKFLNDDQIEQEIIASGTTGERYVSEIDVTNRANIFRVKKEVQNCLSDNVIWRNHILEIIDYLTNEKKKIKKIRCSIYNPMNIIYSIYLIHSNPSWFLYIPSYQIEVEYEDEFKMYIGYLDGNFKNVTVDQVLEKFWNSDAFEFYMSLTWEGYTKSNIEICEFIGVDYKTMLIKKKGEENLFYNYKNYKFIESEYFDPIENIFDKIQKNTSLIPEIISFLDNHNLGNGIWQV